MMFCPSAVLVYLASVWFFHRAPSIKATCLGFQTSCLCATPHNGISHLKAPHFPGTHYGNFLLPRHSTQGGEAWDMAPRGKWWLLLMQAEGERNGKRGWEERANSLSIFPWMSTFNLTNVDSTDSLFRQRRSPPRVATCEPEAQTSGYRCASLVCSTVAHTARSLPQAMSIPFPHSAPHTPRSECTMKSPHSPEDHERVYDNRDVSA